MKKYIKPQLKCIVMNCDTQLLSGSEKITYDPNNTQESKDAWNEAMGKTTISGSLWDIDSDDDD